MPDHAFTSLHLKPRRRSCRLAAREARPDTGRGTAAWQTPALVPEPRTESLYYATGFAMHIENHEFVSRYVGRTAAELEQTRVRATPPPAALQEPEPTESRAASRTHALRVL